MGDLQSSPEVLKPNFGINGPKKGKLIIFLISKWCTSCKLVHTTLEKFKDDNVIELKMINIDENGELVRKLNIYAVPTLLFFKDGKLLDKDIIINGEIFVKKGIMIGATGELILKEIFEQM